MLGRWSLNKCSCQVRLSGVAEHNDLKYLSASDCIELVERFNGTLLVILQKKMRYVDWAEKLCWAIHCYARRMHTSLGIPPLKAFLESDSGEAAFAAHDIQEFWLSRVRESRVDVQDVFGATTFIW